MSRSRMDYEEKQVTSRGQLSSDWIGTKEYEGSEINNGVTNPSSVQAVNSVHVNGRSSDSCGALGGTIGQLQFKSVSTGACAVYLITE